MHRGELREKEEMGNGEVERTRVREGGGDEQEKLLRTESKRNKRRVNKHS